MIVRNSTAEVSSGAARRYPGVCGYRATRRCRSGTASRRWASSSRIRRAGSSTGTAAACTTTTGEIRRLYGVRRWIACRLEFRGRLRRPLLQPGRYTELFFLDEATALAAGHRACAECRREDYVRLARDPRLRRSRRDRRAAARRAPRPRLARAATPRRAARRASRRRVRPAGRRAVARARRAAAALDAGRLPRARPRPVRASRAGDHAAVARRRARAPAGTRSSRCCIRRLRDGSIRRWRR